jgi:hypothetical protein
MNKKFEQSNSSKERIAKLEAEIESLAYSTFNGKKISKPSSKIINLNNDKNKINTDNKEFRINLQNDDNRDSILGNLNTFKKTLKNMKRDSANSNESDKVKL